MRIKNVKLKWNVMFYDRNKKDVVKYNILNDNFKDELVKNIRSKKITNYNELKEYFNKYARYCYWSKSECEMAVGDLFVKSIDDLVKVDIYYQIEMNIDNIISYLINELKIDFSEENE
jgi:hypothetical protein